jgi:hypothetical protein
MPTDTDLKIAEALAGLRVDVAERFGRVDARFAAVEQELAIIRKLGTWLLGGVFGLVATLITGAATIGWAASAVNSRVDQHGRVLEELRGEAKSQGRRLDGIDAKLDMLIGRTAPKSGDAP